ncbi:MAG: nucleotidyltransferase domain-containing protein [Candidatus Helarchaeota archaeon]
MQGRSSNIVKIKLFKLDYDKIIRELRNEIDIWRKKCNLKLVILFGSLAKGSYSCGSDADLLIIADNIPPTYSSRIDLFFSPKISAGLHLIIYTQDELFNEIQEINTFVFEIFYKFKLLYGNKNLLNKILKEIKHKISEKKAIRHNYGWEILNK